MPTLDWAGKADAITAAKKIPYRLLEYDSALSCGEGDNLIVQGDNLEVLKSLLPFYRRRVKCIYIDPPYNTGSAFEHYDDNLEHSLWLSMMYPRLELLREFLSDDGAIFISIDDNEQAYLKVICDELFGRNNFVANMIWKCKSGGANDVKGIACDTENILVYAKDISVSKFNKDIDAQVSTNYNHTDTNGRRYSLDRLDKQSLGYQASLDFPITGTDGKIYVVEHKNPKNKVARWRWSKETVTQRYDELVFKYPYVYTKNYEKTDGAIPRNLLVDERFGRTRSGKTELAALFDNISPFAFPKPTKLIKFLLSIATDKNSIILDAFAGSGTTAHAVINLNATDGGNRKFILIEEKDYCRTITAERVKRVGGTFKFYRLGAELFDETGAINPAVTFEQLAAYVWSKFTGTPYTPGDSPLIGIHEGAAYYLLDETLTPKILETLPPHDGAKIIFGKACRISKENLKLLGITFRQIPKDIR